MAELTWISEGVFTVAGLLTPRDCGAYIDLAESIGFTDAPINTMFGPERRPEVRNNRRVMLDAPNRAAELWNRIRPYTPLQYGHWNAVGTNERLRFYRYDPGQQFDWHHDGCYERETGERSRLTYMIYLNDGFVGGETLFRDLPPAALPGSKVIPKAGLALVFSHPLLHKGARVKEGRKYVLRTEIMYSWQSDEK